MNMSLHDFLKKMSGITTNEEILYGNPKIRNKRPMCDCHQRHIPRRAKAEVIKRLGGASSLWILPSHIHDFELLHSEIRSLIGNIPGIGNLTIYDVTVRLGAKYNILPRDYVYLHAGPMVSAKHLEKIGRITLTRPLSPCVPTTDFSSIYSMFSSPTAFDIESDLCTRKNEILKLV